MPSELIQHGLFAGVSVNDAFARAATRESAVTVDLGPISWPPHLAPTPQPLGHYKPGAKITGAVDAKADVLVLLYTEQETSALLDVFTQNKAWTPARRQTWYPYAHNFDHVKSTIEGLRGDVGLEQGILGYLYALTIGGTSVVFYKTELHPKANGNKLPFVPVIAQLVSELGPKLVISTGTAGAIGSHVNCGDVAITAKARFRCRNQYPSYPQIDAMSSQKTELKNDVAINDKYIKYAAEHFTKLSLPGLAECYGKLASRPEYSFLKKNTQAPAIYVTAASPVPGNQPMDIVSADYLTVDDSNDSEGLQALGIMNDTNDAFAFFAIDQAPSGTKPQWLSIRNASEPQIRARPFPPGTSPTQIVDALKGTAGAIYGVYQYCTTLNSAFACWGVIAGLN